MRGHPIRIVIGTALAALLLALPVAASGATRYVRTTGSDANAATGCGAGAPCLTIGGAVNAAATIDGDTIDIGAGTFSAPTAAISETLDFVGNGPGPAGMPPDPGTTLIDAGAGPQEGLELLKGGSVSNLRVKGASGGAFSEALVLGTNDAAATRNYAVSNVVAIGGHDPTFLAEPALLATDAGAAGGTVNATVSGYFEGDGAMPSGTGPGIVGATGTNVNLTVNDSTLEFISGGMIPATVQGAAALTLNRTRVPDETAPVGVLSSGTDSELTVNRSEIEARETPVQVQDFGGGTPGNVAIRDSRLVARPPVAAVEGERALLAIVNATGGTLDVDIDGSTLAAIGPDVEEALLAWAGNNPSGVNVTASNTIFRAKDTAPAPDGSARDIRAIANLGAAAQANVTADHSSYTTVAQPNFGGVTPAGSGTNISGNPQFANELGFDLTLDGSSPLIDAGAAGVSGPLDVAANPREVDASCDGTAEPDVGAYERAANCPPPPQPPEPQSEPQTEPQPEPPPADTDPPETTVNKAKVNDDDVTVKFSSDEPGSRFECKLDKKAFKGCRSPKRYRNLDEGKHRVLVVAIDAAGNRDASAARRKFEIK